MSFKRKPINREPLKDIFYRVCRARHRLNRVPDRCRTR